MKRKAVILLSGGLDSTVALHLAHQSGIELHTLSFAYGQRHTRELACAEWQSRAVNATSHRVVDLSFSSWGGSSLTDLSIAVEKGQTVRLATPNTYVPARNMVFLSIAASVAETIGAHEVHIGVSEVDYSGYVDCRGVFIRAMEEAINLGTERLSTNGERMSIIAPFLHMAKSEEVLLGQKLGVNFSHTWSCYQGDVSPCCQCDSCLLRARAFAEARIPDPLAEYPGKITQGK